MPPSDGDPSYIFLYLIILIGLLYLSGFFSGSETALMAVGKLKLRQMTEGKDDKKLSKTVRRFIEKPNRMLTAVLVMNNLVNILASAVATLLALRLLPETSEGIAAALVTGIMTFLVLVFGEITPKIHARENPEKVFTKVVPVIAFFTAILEPILKFLLSISNAFIVLLGGRKVSDTPFITEDEIVLAVDTGHQEGVLQSDESKIMKRALVLKDISVNEIMTPRVEIEALDENAPLLKLLRIIENEGYSRIPIYRQSIDRIVGVCFAKDLLKFMSERSNMESILSNTPVKEIMRPAFFVPETKKLDDLLKEFIEEKNHLAVVIDEYGGTAGLISMEDIIEELTGEILDEYDLDSEITIERVSDNEYIVDGITPINDIERELDKDFPDTDFETVGGFLLEVLERFPAVGETLRVDGFTFEILAAGKNKIEKVRLRIDREEAETGREDEKYPDSEGP
ncbi:MAG: Uncharacterized protein XE05_0284 [Thermotogales bacterium 46_20]|nr:MAG: Uncharacterized protein XE05_0284 [Thermotogales bacterium 46_20]